MPVQVWVCAYAYSVYWAYSKEALLANAPNDALEYGLYSSGEAWQVPLNVINADAVGYSQATYVG